MTVQLNEYCLLEIFRHLSPLEWVQISEVSRVWHRVVVRSLKNVSTRIRIEDADRRFSPHKEKEVSAETARKFLLLTAFSVEEVTVELQKNITSVYYIDFHSYCYKVKGRRNEIRHSLIQFALAANEVKDIKFNYMSTALQVEVTNILLKQKKLKKVSTTGGNSLSKLCKFNLTERIHHLDYVLNFLSFDKLSQVSLQGHFPNLWTLNLIYYGSMPGNEVRNCLSQILPHVSTTLKSLRLRLYETDNKQRLPSTCDIFDDIFKLSKLEELQLDVSYWPYGDAVKAFLDKFTIFLPQLQSIQICRISNRGIFSLLSHPHLRAISICPEQNFSAKELPTNHNLTECNFKLDHWRNSKMSYGTEVVKMIKKMPNLKRFRFESFDSFHVSAIGCKLIEFAASECKNIIFTFELRLYLRPITRKLIIKKIGGHQNEKKTLCLYLSSTRMYYDEFRCVLDELLRKANSYLNRNTNNNYHAFISNA